jgi:hypothetical protein
MWNKIKLLVPNPLTNAYANSHGGGKGGRWIKEDKKDERNRNYQLIKTESNDRNNNSKYQRTINR